MKTIIDFLNVVEKLGSNCVNIHLCIKFLRLSFFELPVRMMSSIGIASP